MTNDLYRDLTRIRAATTVAAAKSFRNVEHHGLEGHLREILIRELLRPLLPSDIGLGTGKIIDSDNKVSSEQDVLLYDRSILPPVLLEGSTGLFPVESVLCAIEVKSTLTFAALKNAHNKALGLKDLRYLTGKRNEKLKLVQHPVMNVVPALFAFGSSLKKRSELDRYAELVADDGQSGFAMICVVGRGMWNLEGPLQWREHILEGEFDEIVHFMGVLMNTYPVVASTRGLPPLGEYLYAASRAGENR